MTLDCVNDEELMCWILKNVAYKIIDRITIWSRHYIFIVWRPDPADNIFHVRAVTYLFMIINLTRI